MAASTTVIDLIFNGVDKTGAASAAVLKNLENFANGAKNITQPVADFTATAAKLEAGILGVGASVVAFSVKVASDFDGAFRELTTLFDAASGDTAKFRDDIQEYASTSTQSIEKIEQSLLAAVGTGIKYSESLGLVAKAEKLSVATRADLEGTTKVLVSTMNAYGMETSDIDKISDLFFRTIADGNIKMDDLSKYLANVTPNAKIAGVSLEELLAAIATLTTSGVNPSTAIDALNSAISNIIGPSEQAKKLAAELGIEFNATGLKSKGFAGLLAEVAKATGGSAEKLKLLFGDMNGFSAVASLTGAQADKFAESIDNMGKATGGVDEAFNKMKDSVEGSTAVMQNAMTALFTKIGTPLLDEVGGISKAIAGIFNGLGASVKDGNLGGLVEFIESVLGDIQKAFEDVAKNIPEALAQADLMPFQNGIKAVIDALKNLFGNIDLTTVEGLREGIEFAGLAFLKLSEFTAGVIKSFKPLLDAMMEAAKGAKGMGDNFFETMGEIGGFAKQLNVLLPALTAFAGLMAANAGVGLVTGIKALAGTAPSLASMAAVLTGPAGLTAAVGAAGLAGAAGVGAAAGTLLKESIDGVLTAVTGSKTTLGGWIYDLTHSGDAAGDMSEKTDSARESVGKITQEISQTSGQVMDKYGNLTKAVNTFGNELAKTTGLTDKEIEAQIKNATAVGNARRVTEELARKKADLAAVMVEKVVPVFDAATGKIIGYETQLVKVAAGSKEASAQQAMTAGAIKKSADEAKKAEEATRKWNEEVQKMQHVEKLALIEAQSKITTAQIEADAEKTVAAFDSMNAGIQSTGETISNLVGELKGLDGLDKLKVLDLIEDEADRRKELFGLQKDMITQQIALMKAKVAAMQKGDALIKIEGDGLKPHLEAFMWEILRTIQTRVNADGLDMLLGA